MSWKEYKKAKDWTARRKEHVKEKDEKKNKSNKRKNENNETKKR